jgi:very-short-patch-repair endonuclease
MNEMIRLDYLPQLNYAMWQHGQQCLRRVEIENTTDADWRQVTVRLSGDLIQTQVEHLELVPRGQVVVLSRLQIVPEADTLRQLTESVAVHFDVTIKKAGDADEAPLAQQSFELRLLAFDEWPGVQVSPELLSAFVMPNVPELSPILLRASALLEKLTGSGSLDEYQTQDPNRVRAQVACLYTALREVGLVYSAPPASFERTGQRVRLAPAVINQKLATCLDLSLLMASCMEACGLHPLVLLLRGHAMVGCWLTNKYHPHTVGDDASLLLKSSANGINEMVLIESTALTTSQPVPFEDAVDMAEKRLLAKPDDFVLFVDIFRCRLDHVLPLPLQTDGTLLAQSTPQREAATVSVAQQSTVNVNVAEAETPTDRLNVWERKLLDFTMRNSLLNLRLTKKTIPFISFDLDVLEDHLQAGESYELLPSPSKQKIQPDEGNYYLSRLHRDELEGVVAQGLKQNQLYSYLDTDELASAIKTLYRESRTAMEENGADTLFLAMGMLKWYETEKSVVPRYAPLVMLPARLVRKSAGSYVLRMRDEDTTFNTTLVEMLRQTFGINITGLAPLPKDESGVDMRAIFSIVRAHVKEFARWDVIEEAMMGLFSFSKFVMWNDIHSNSDLMRRNHIVDGLLQQHFAKETATDGEVDVRQADNTLPPTAFALPVDVDSSQLEAVIESGQQRSFILYGPPGTGKSQTITNIISNALYHGKRVLFVAEKMAALQVVQARMEKIGLAPFCLEMHSNKMTKSHLLQQLQSVLDLGMGRSSTQYAKVADELMARRKELITYTEELHRKRQHGLSLHDCIVRYESMPDVQPLNPSEEFLQVLTSERLDTAAKCLRELDAVMKISGHPSSHPLQGLEIVDASERARQQLAGELPRLSQQIRETLQATHDNGLRLSGVNTWLEYIAKQEELLSTYTDDVLSLKPRQLEGEWNAIQQKWFLPRFFARRSFANRMRAYKADFNPEADVEALCQKLDDCQRLASTCGCDRQLVVGAATSKACRELDAKLKSLTPQLCRFDLGTDDPQLAMLDDRIGQWMPHMERSRDWAQWCMRLPALREQQLQFAINEMERDAVSGSSMADRVLRGAYKRIALDIIDADTNLSMFNGVLFDDVISRYRDLSAEFQQLTKKMLYSQMTKRLPHLAASADAAKPDKGDKLALELAQLKRWIATGGRGVTIRRIMDQLPTLLPQLCPCMLMSPISVAQYIDLNQPPFDLVVFDEASQMPTSEAVGAIARGRNLIVVGDPKQMPPTSFFTTNAIDESEADIDDMESILDDCITLSLPEHYLSWHYRSRHESLIAFSNSQYYDGRLFTFPSVDDRQSRVRFVPVEGVYDHGRTRSNRAEAVAIVEETLRRLPNDDSIGIVAFSKVQQNLIEDLLTEELAKHPELEKRAYDAAEPVFVKNLENVQGDERDIILFSVGYGPDKNGKVSMNFGPLNNRGGERRLNVAVSRARKEMVVFSTLQPEQIDLNRRNARGVEGLKRFLEFAKSGRMAVAAGQMKASPQADSIVEALAQELRQRGYQVDTKVGRSQFKIDIAIVDKQHPERYILGILCDGQSYYETKTERDREVVRPGVLAGLQWKLLRVWSIDWFANRQGVMERIEQALNSEE